MTQKFDLSWLGVGITVVVCSFFLFGFLQVILTTSNSMISSQGHIYTGSGISTDLSSIDWQTMYPDTNKNVTVNVTNELPHDQTLSMFTSGWIPANATDYMALSWNYTGATLGYQETIPVNLTLTVYENVTGFTTFSFNITINGS